MCAGHDLDDSALAAAIFTQQMIGLTKIDCHVDAAQRMNAAKPLMNVAQFEETIRAIGRSGHVEFLCHCFLICKLQTETALGSIAFSFSVEARYSDAA